MTKRAQFNEKLSFLDTYSQTEVESWKVHERIGVCIATFIVLKYTGNGVVPYNAKLPTGSLASGSTGTKSWKVMMDAGWDPKGVFSL